MPDEKDNLSEIDRLLEDTLMEVVEQRKASNGENESLEQTRQKINQILDGSSQPISTPPTLSPDPEVEPLSTEPSSEVSSSTKPQTLQPQNLVSSDVEEKKIAPPPPVRLPSKLTAYPTLATNPSSVSDKSPESSSPAVVTQSAHVTSEISELPVVKPTSVPKLANSQDIDKLLSTEFEVYETKSDEETKDLTEFAKQEAGDFLEFKPTITEVEQKTEETQNPLPPLPPPPASAAAGGSQLQPDSGSKPLISPPISPPIEKTGPALDTAEITKLGKTQQEEPVVSSSKLPPLPQIDQIVKASSATDSADSEGDGFDLSLEMQAKKLFGSEYNFIQEKLSEDEKKKKEAADRAANFRSQPFVLKKKKGKK